MRFARLMFGPMGAIDLLGRHGRARWAYAAAGYPGVRASCAAGPFAGFGARTGGGDWPWFAGPGARGAGDGRSRGRGCGPGDDGQPFTRGRKFSSEDLQLMLLGLIEENPSHGYELIKQLAARSNGFYSPSPGMVYPTLTWLEEGGLVSVEADGSKKRYQLAEPGREYLGEHRERLTMLWNKLQHIARKMEWMRRAWSGEAEPARGAAAAQAASPASAEPDDWLADFVDARRQLKQTLLARSGADQDEQRRIAAILREAARRIDEGSSGSSGSGASGTSGEPPPSATGPEGDAA
ncbi:MAG: PadR family transcriptional regulator [Burkholderiaceae bacterium]